MACSLSRTLIRIPKAAAAAASSHSRSHYSYYYSTRSPSQLPEAEALAVRKIEDAIHRIIVKRSAPDWLPFVPGASYWVPPKRTNYGMAHLLANSLSDHDQLMSLTTSRGWPSSAFYIHPPDASSDRREVVETSTRAPFSEDEEG